MNDPRPEPWLRGPVPGIPPLLQPAAHAIGKVLEDAESALAGLSEDGLWQAPAALPAEPTPPDRRPTQTQLIARLRAALDAALRQLAITPEARLLHPRTVGRARLPSTVLGLLLHAAEPGQRHTGQLVTTARIVRGPAAPRP